MSMLSLIGVSIESSELVLLRFFWEVPIVDTRLQFCPVFQCLNMKFVVLDSPEKTPFPRSLISDSFTRVS